MAIASLLMCRAVVNYDSVGKAILGAGQISSEY